MSLILDLGYLEIWAAVRGSGALINANNLRQRIATWVPGDRQDGVGCHHRCFITIPLYQVGIAGQYGWLFRAAKGSRDNQNI